MEILEYIMVALVMGIISYIIWDREDKVVIQRGEEWDTQDKINENEIS
jgi:hypothetical protein